MKIYQRANYTDMSHQVANIIAAQVILKPNCVLGLATGSTPIGAYKELIHSAQIGDISFAQVSSINLDEYVGLSPAHNQSYRYFMESNLFDHINIRREFTNVPNGLADDLDTECKRYNQLIEDIGGIDLQLLGMGHNGHVGFNEPNSHFTLGTNHVTLAKSTIEANARFFDDDLSKVPTAAITMGIKNIMQSKTILVAVSGEDKADIVYKAFCGPVTPQVPSSILPMHPNVILVGDNSALHKLIQAGELVCD